MGNKSELTDALFKMLHPDYASLSEEEKKALIYEQRYIEEHKIEIMSEFASHLGKHNMRESEMLSVIVNRSRYSQMAEELFGSILATPYWLNLEENLSKVDTVRFECEEVGMNNPLQFATKKVWSQNMFDALYPNYNNLSTGEQFFLTDEKRFILERVEEIEKLSGEIYRNRNGEISSVEALRMSVNILRTKEIFHTLHPDYDSLSPVEQYYLASEHAFIGDHLDEILHLQGEIYYTGEKTESEAWRMSVDRLRTKEVFETLHPDYDSLSDEEKFIVEDERQHILGQLPQITELQARYERNGSEPLDALRSAVDYTRAGAMFDSLYPNINSLSPEEQYNLMGERDFIFEHVQEISRLKQQAILSNPGMTQQAALVEAVDVAKTNNSKKM